jgi:hypothetical protein
MKENENVTPVDQGEDDGNESHDLTRFADSTDDLFAQLDDLVDQVDAVDRRFEGTSAAVSLELAKAKKAITKAKRARAADIIDEQGARA